MGLFVQAVLFCFPQTLSDGKNSLPKYQQKLLKKQINKNQSNIMILLQQVRKSKCLCDSVICLTSICLHFAFALPSATDCFLEIFARTRLWHAGTDTELQCASASCIDYNIYYSHVVDPFLSTGSLSWCIPH